MAVESANVVCLASKSLQFVHCNSVRCKVVTSLQNDLDIMNYNVEQLMKQAENLDEVF